MPMPPSRPPVPALAWVVDDHPLVASGIANYLQAHCRMTAVQVHASLPPGPAAPAPALLVLDHWLAGQAPLDVLIAWRHHHPHTRVLMISGDVDPAVWQAARAAGADGFVHKHEPPETFGAAVQALLAGLHWFPADAPPPARSTELGLTQRQQQVLDAVLRGWPNRRIAEALHLSEATIKNHVTAIYAQLGVANRIELLVRLAPRRG